jgi:hypothetical protein
MCFCPITTSKLTPKVGTCLIVAINNRMVMLQVYVNNNAVEDIVLKGGLGINIIMDQL